MPVKKRFLQDKLVLITGASSGIGEACALQFADAGARVILVARNGDRLKKVWEEIMERGGWAEICPLDISDSDAVQRASAELLSKQGIPDILINNAGSGIWKFIHETEYAELPAYMEVPYYGAFYMSKAFLPSMLERGSGHIVNMSSYAGVIPFSGATAYMVARKAMIGFHEALTADLHRTGIRTSLAYFARVRSDYWSNNPGSEERLPGVASLVPTIQADRAAKAILNGVRRGRSLIYTPKIIGFFNLLYRLFPATIRWWLHTTDKVIDSKGTP